jgi:hypothetical protein
MVTCSGKDLVKHIEEYEKRLNVSFFEDWDLNDYPFLILFPDGSFFTYGIRPDAIEVGPSSCKLKKAKEIVVFIAKKLGLHRIVTNTTRNLAAYERLSGGICFKAVRKNGKTTYYFEMEVS